MKRNPNQNQLHRSEYALASMRFLRVSMIALVALLLTGAMPTLALRVEGASSCEFWVAPYPSGDNSAPGTAAKPWATMDYAAQQLPDENCTVWVAEGSYYGEIHFVERFEQVATFKAMVPYQTTLENRGTVLNFDGARNIVIDGFSVRHTAPGDVQVVKVDRSSKAWSEQITFRNNIFHDSYSDDLMKIYNGVRFVTIENNIFFNQASREEHIDVNSVTDITIQDNIFFNDYAGSGRTNAQDTKSFITIKDSNGDVDEQIGSERIRVRRNIFLNWEGGKETFIQVGNDGKPYYEAKDISIDNNLLIGNGLDLLYAPFGARGVKNLTFANNTIVGDLPSSAFAMWVSLKDDNPINKNLFFVNNIWSDPTGTMGASNDSENKFSNGDPDETEGLLLDNNLYWNGDRKVPAGDLVSPRKDDANRIIADPLLNGTQEDIVLPRWNGSSFLSGSTSIRHEFIRLVEAYGKTRLESPAIGQADPDYTPKDDILGLPRVGLPDIGAYEYYPLLSGGARLTQVLLNWSDFGEPLAVSFTISYTNGHRTYFIDNIPTSTNSFTLTGLVPYSLYTITVTAHDEDERVLGQSTPLVLMTTSDHSVLPYALNVEQQAKRPIYPPQVKLDPNVQGIIYEQ